ncbi:23700_t:CDS:2 [Gigaspora rosea]|nr:23700_t:CDS:2 [Gigaspora rosea]
MGPCHLTDNQFTDISFHQQVFSLPVISPQISYAIKRYVRIGYDISEGSDIVDAAKELSGTYLANIQPNRTKKEVN